MNTISYSVLQYRHDRALGEAINVGVLAYSPAENRAAIEYDQHIGLLSKLYAGFDRVGLRSALKRLSQRVALLNRDAEIPSLPGMAPRAETAYDLVRLFWPDQGSSLAADSPRFVASSDVKEEAKRLFDRLVASVRPEHAYRGSRNDEDVWESMLRRMKHVEGLAAQFQPHVFADEIELDYVAQRESDQRFLAVEPLAFDYLHGSRVKERAYEVAGKAIGLSGVSDFERLIVVIGEVDRNVEASKAVNWSRHFLSGSRLKIEVINENEHDRLRAALAG